MKYAASLTLVHHKKNIYDLVFSGYPPDCFYCSHSRRMYTNLVSLSLKVDTKGLNWIKTEQKLAIRNRKNA